MIKGIISIILGLMAIFMPSKYYFGGGKCKHTGNLEPSMLFIISTMCAGILLIIIGILYLV